MPHDWITLDPTLASATIAVLAAGGVVLAVVLMRQRWTARARNRKHLATAQLLSGALDRIDIGLVLLDADTRAEFINRAYRAYFALPDDKADSKPPLVALMYHARDTHAFHLPDHEIDDFITRNVEAIRAGDAAPVTLRLNSGRVLLRSCTALPDGGRMLSYTPVTELIRYSDNQGDRDYYLALREGDIFQHQRIHAAE